MTFVDFRLISEALRTPTGDYDGDTVLIIWQPELVEPFRNAAEEYGQEPESVERCFESQIKTVSQFMESCKDMSELGKIQHFQEHALASVRSRSLVGQYSSYYDYAVYTLGYNHPDTRRLAFM